MTVEVSEHMRVLETRSYLSCRFQIGEETTSGWTVVVYPPKQEEPVTLQCNDPAGLSGLIAQAKAKAAEFEAVIASAPPA